MTNRTNDTQHVVDDARKALEAYAWPGGYPVMYMTRDGFRDDAGKLEVNPHDRTEAVCCAKCAKDTAKWPDLIVTGHFVHYEGAPEQCEYCNEFTESAYGDPEAEVNDDAR